jgi:GH15 family glucan-1,4-alpha-glucosidase
VSQQPGGPDRSVATSVKAMLDHQHTSGAFVASPDFAEYRYCWLRDGSFVAHALDRAGELAAAGRFHDWCARAINRIAPVISEAVQQRSAGKAVDPSGMPPARFSLEGLVVDDDWPNFQVDGYGTWLWSLHEHLRMCAAQALPDELAPAVALTARYLSQLGTSPCFDVWEEDGGSVHTATLGCVYAGLSSAAEMLGDPSLADRAAELRTALVERARAEGRFVKSDQSRQVDAALLWLCKPFGVVAPDEPAFVATARQIATELDLDGGVRRYAADTYYGGGAWPVLTASLGWYHAAVGELGAARLRQDWIAQHIDDKGRLAEQFGGEQRDPVNYGEWVKRWGPPAADLLWSHAMYVVLATEIAEREVGAGAAATKDQEHPDRQT